MPSNEQDANEIAAFIKGLGFAVVETGIREHKGEFLISLTASFDEKDTWSNQILQNSRYVKMFIDMPDRVEILCKGQGVTKMRSFKYKDVATTTKNIQKWFDVNEKRTKALKAEKALRAEINHKLFR